MMSDALAVEDVEVPIGPGRLGRPTREIAERLGDHILEVALRQFCARGLDSTSMNSIAQAANVSKRTLYSRFQDRESLLLAAVERGVTNLIIPISATMPEGGMRDQLHHVAVEMVEASLRPEVIELERLLAALAESRPEIYQQIALKVQNARLDLIQSVFCSAVQRKEFNAEKIDIAASLAFDCLVTNPRREMLKAPEGQDRSEHLRSYLDRVIDILLYGILSDHF